MGGGAGGHFSGTKGSGKTRTVHGFTTKIHSGKQEKHIIGTNNYQKGKSIFKGSSEDAQKLINEYAGKGTWLGNNKERVNFGRIIGKYVDRSTGREQETSWGIIHYSKSGTHIVPSEPID